MTELEKEAEEWLDIKYLPDMGVRRPCKVAYLAGAEPREKRIAELKKENKILIQENEERDKRIAELEKENKELIQENEEMKKDLGCETCQIHLEYKRLNDKITELEKENAWLKELIRTDHPVGNDEFWKSVWACKMLVDDLKAENEKLKKHQIQWHELEEDPNDLPPKKEGSDKSDKVVTNKGIGHYDYIKQGWYVDSSEHNMTFSMTGITAWCKMPRIEVWNEKV